MTPSSRRRWATQNSSAVPQEGSGFTACGGVAVLGGTVVCAGALGCMPTEVLNLTLSFLDGPDVCRTGMSCRALSSRVLSSEAVWAAMILPHRFGPAVLGLFRGKMTWCHIYSRLRCYDRKQCPHCFEPCESPELPTASISCDTRPLCLWAKRL
jgi:hypothetical protein